MDTAVIREFQRLKALEAELRADLNEVEAARKELEEQVTTQLIEEGVQNINIDGQTVYLRRDVYPSYPAGKEAAIALLAADPAHQDIVQQTINHQTVCALLRELDGNYPAEWQGIIEVADVYRVGLRKS